MEDRLTKLLEYVRADGRICPNPQEWTALWEMLPNKKRIGPSWEPPLPLILAAWHDTPGLLKMLRLQEHIYFAAEHGVIDEIDIYLRSLKEEQWFYGN